MPTAQELNVPDKLDSILTTKQAIREAIVAKGVEVPEGTVFREYADKISQISEVPIDPFYYGVKIDKTVDDSETSIEYIDDAVGFAPGYDFWKHVSLIQQIRPCVLKDGKVKYYLDRNDFTKKSDGSDAIIDDISEGDVMIEFPKIGYKMESDEQYQYIWITNDQNAEGYNYDAFSLDDSGDCDRLYIGAYLSYLEGGMLYSVSGKSPESGIHMEDACNFSLAKGNGYQPFSFFPLTLIQCIYTVVYKNLNSQSALGQGFTASSNAAKTNTGGTDKKGFCYGEETGTEQVKFMGIEDLWGNLYEYVDGVQTDSNGNIYVHYKSFADSDNYAFLTAGNPDNLVGYIKEIYGTNTSGFIAKVVGNGASSNKYYSDYGVTYTKNFMRHGGTWNYGTNSFSGIYLEFLNLSKRTTLSIGNDIGSRIVYKHKRPT